MEEGGIHIALAPERLFSLWGLPITNTLISAWAVMVLLIIVGFLVGRNPKLIPGRVQTAFEWLFEFVLKFMEDLLGTRAMAERFFPLIATVFLFIFTSNMLDFFPLMGAVVFETHGEALPLLRPVNTDLNTTLALAIIAYVVIEATGIVMLGFLKYGSKFVNLKSGAVGFFMGLIELVSNFARLISFSFRLFGNIFAGEVLITVIIFFLPFAVPVPLMLFETFVGLVQASIFALLILVFIKVAIEEPHQPAQAGGEHKKEAGHA